MTQAFEEVGRMTANPLTKQKFLSSHLGITLRDELIKMVKNPDYNTTPIYSTFVSDEFQFVEKHMTYMSRFPAMDHHQYVLNLKLMTKIRQSPHKHVS